MKENCLNLVKPQKYCNKNMKQVNIELMIFKSLTIFLRRGPGIKISDLLCFEFLPVCSEMDTKCHASA